MKTWAMDDTTASNEGIPSEIEVSALPDGRVTLRIREVTGSWAFSWLSPSKARRLAEALREFADAAEKGGRD
jgi:hypothetical protein